MIYRGFLFTNIEIDSLEQFINYDFELIILL